MMNRHELYVSSQDAEALAAMLAAHRRAHAFEADASDELADLLMAARLTERLPADRIGMNATVTYAEEPSGRRRTVTLAYPEAADAAKGRISVLSPVGLALIGRRRGAVARALMPNGREAALRILELFPGAESRADAA